MGAFGLRQFARKCSDCSLKDVCIELFQPVWLGIIEEPLAQFCTNWHNNLSCASIGLTTDAPGDKSQCYNTLSHQENRNVRWGACSRT
jgi:hypothetical protein